MTRGRDLPKYITRRKRDGVLLFRKRDGKRIVEIRLETQFPARPVTPSARPSGTCTRSGTPPLLSYFWQAATMI